MSTPYGQGIYGTGVYSLGVAPVISTSSYYFGSYLLNSFTNGVGGVLLSKNVDLPAVVPTSFPVARREGTRKSGEQVKERIIIVDLKVVGTSRLDLMNRLDALMQALSLRSQQLIIHEDGRYFQSVDATAIPIKFTVGRDIVAVTVSVTFVAYDPFAYASSASSYDTGTLTLTNTSAGIYSFPTITMSGGGTAYSLPLIRIYNRTVSGGAWTSITILQATDNQTISATATVSVPLPAANGEYVDIQCDPTAVNGWSIQTNTSGNFSTPSGLFPVIESGPTVFHISIASSAAIIAQALFTWKPRYLN